MAHREAATVIAEELDTVILDRLRNQARKHIIMNATFKNLSALAIAFSMSMAVTAAHAKGPGNAKSKGKQDANAQGQHGRDAGELPFGLEQFSDKNGNLPTGLQKKKDADGSLTHGLEDAGKPVKATGKALKG
jgi:hypothetical protein